MHRKVELILAMLVVCSAFAFVAAAGRVQSNASPHAAAVVPAGQTADKKAEEQFKNIQTLKGIPADQLIPTMQFITASLGVECDFCHVQGAFEKDDKKPKQTARKMMEMMFAINADDFDRNREVTCYTCHRGNAKPVGMPSVMAQAPKEAAEPAKTGDSKPYAGPAAEQLLDKYLQASGGSAAIDKITSRVMKGTIDFGGQSLPIDIYTKDPQKRISFIHMPGGDNVTAFNGREGWLGMPGRPLREMHGGDLDGAAIDADLHLATHLKQMFSGLKAQGSGKVDDRETYLVVGERSGKPPIELYFDQQTGLLLRLVRYSETALGRMPTQIDYADYRDADGVKVPYRWTLARPGGRFTIQVSEMQQNVPVDDAKFVKPAPEPEPPKGPGK